ncbi:CLUMA_CG010350, isoform B, partial [Clunio marinus]
TVFDDKPKAPEEQEKLPKDELSLPKPLEDEPSDDDEKDEKKISLKSPADKLLIPFKDPNVTNKSVTSSYSSTSYSDIRSTTSTVISSRMSEHSFVTDSKTVESDSLESNISNVSKLLAQPYNADDDKTSRKQSIKSELSEYMGEDELYSTDITSSSMTYVSDPLESKTDTTTSEDDHMHPLKSLTQTREALIDYVKEDVTKTVRIGSEKLTSLMSVTSSKSDKQQSDLSPDSFISGPQDTQYERSISFSDNAASDVSSECKFEETVVTLPYDSEKDDHTTESITRSSSSMSKTQELNKNYKQLAQESRIEHTSSPQSDVTEFTESMSIADSVLEGVIADVKAAKALRSSVSSVDDRTPDSPKSESGKKKLKCTDIVLNKVPKPLMSYKKIEKKDVVETPSKVQEKETTKTDSKGKSLTITKTSTRKSNIVSKPQTSVEVSKSSTMVTKTTSRVYGYMQSTVSRDQKIGKVTHIAQRSTTHSTSESDSSKVEKKHVFIEDKKDQIETIEFKQENDNIKKATPSPTKKSYVVDNKTRDQSSIQKRFTKTVPKDTKEKSKSPRISESDKSEKTSSTTSTSTTMSKMLKDKKNSSLIPIKKLSTTEKPQTDKAQKQISKKDTSIITSISENKSHVVEKTSTTKTSSIKKSSKQVQKISSTTKVSDKPTVISRKKKKTERDERSDSQDSLDMKKKVTQKVQKVESVSVSSSRKKTSRVKAPTTTAITQAEISYRSQSAMHYANKDSITFQHDEIPSSMPSSPNHDERDVMKSSVTVDKESISPILEFQAVSPQRQKHKFTYEKKGQECRRRKGKSKNSQQKPKSNFLDTKFYVDLNASGHTDVEDLDVEEDDVLLKDKSYKSSSTDPETYRKASTSNADGKTDIEYISDDGTLDLLRFSPEIKITSLNDFQFEACTLMSFCESLDTKQNIKFELKMPEIRMISPTSERYQTNTDVEDIQCQSDTDDAATSLSRAQTSTPIELNCNLDDLCSSHVHEIHSGAFDKVSEHEFKFEKSVTEGTEEKDSGGAKGDDDLINLIQTEAITLVDSILEESVTVVNNNSSPFNPSSFAQESELVQHDERQQSLDENSYDQQQQQFQLPLINVNNYSINPSDQAHSDEISDNFAIKSDCDIIVKSPTIESMSAAEESLKEQQQSLIKFQEIAFASMCYQIIET